MVSPNAGGHWRLIRNLADAHGFIGLGKYQSGHSEEVEGHIQEALRLSPRDTRAFLWYMFVGLGKLSIHADPEAIEWFRRSLEANRNHALSHFHFATALALVGDLKEARSIAEAGLALDPGFTSAATASTPRATIRSISRDASATSRVCAWPACRKDD